MKKFKKVLSVALASIMTISSSLPVGATTTPTPKTFKEFRERLSEAFKQNNLNMKDAVIIGAAGAVPFISIVGFGFLLWHAFKDNNDNSGNSGNSGNSDKYTFVNKSEITVGTEGEVLKTQDFEQYFKECVSVTTLTGASLKFRVVHAKIVNIRDGVIGIDDDTLWHCAFAKEIRIPNSVDYIVSKAFKFLLISTPRIVYNGSTYENAKDFLDAFKSIKGHIVIDW